MISELLNKRIPTLFGIGLVALSVIFTSIIVQSQLSLKSNASNSEEPQNVKITNLSDDSFSITYQTDAATTGSVSYGRGKELGDTQVEKSDREKGDLSLKNIHSITVKKLNPSTKYYLVIVSGQNTFLNNGSPFEISTGPNISSPSASQIVVKGKVVLPDGNPPEEAHVYLNTDDSQLLSATVEKNGELKFSLNKLRTEDLSSYLELKENSVLKLSAINKDLKSTVLFSLNQTGIIPTITLSNDYDFTKESVRVASQSAGLESPAFPEVVNQPASLKLQILTPKENQNFIDQRPQFRGTSLPNEKVEVTIHSEENIQAQVTADSNGNWTYRPPTTLSPGVHTIEIKTRDSSGILITIMKSFTVFAQDSQVIKSATPSATPAQTISPTPTLTSISTPFPSPVATLTLTPSSTPSPIILPLPIESKGGIPPTGNSPTLLIIGGIVAAISGIVLFLLTRILL